MEILFTRSLIGFFYCFFLLRGTGHSIFGTKRLYLALRGLLGFGALFCMFSAFILLPLADATVIFFAHPIFVAILAAFLLKETLGTRGVFCIGAALAGVVLVARPSFIFHDASPLDPAAVGIALCAAVLSAGAIVTVRFLSRHEHPLTIIAYPTMAVLVLGPLLDSTSWSMPTPTEFLYLLAMGILMNMGQHLMTMAYQRERAAVIAAIGYVEIPLAALFGALVFGDMPDIWTYAGAALVVGGTLFLGQVRKAGA
jgi:drug/metabolite transporter (DMT)-like permease